MTGMNVADRMAARLELVDGIIGVLTHPVTMAQIVARKIWTQG